MRKTGRPEGGALSSMGDVAMVSEVARMLHVPYERLIKLVRAGKLAGIREGGRWYMTKQMALLAKRCPTGAKSWEDMKWIKEVTNGEATGID